MFNDALKNVTGLLDRRFLLNVFFPCLVFCGLLVVVGIVGAGGDVITLAAAWSKQEGGDTAFTNRWLSEFANCIGWHC